MPAEIAFTDSVGYATLPALGGGFSNWVPDPFDLDDAAERLGSGQVDAFLMRARDGFSFELLLLNTDLPIAQRLVRHLWRGGLCSVDTGLLNVVTPTVYLNMGIATTEDGERIEPVLERADPATVDYRLAVHLEGASASVPSALSVWYLRNLASDADLTLMPEGAHEESMNPYGEADPRATFNQGSTYLVDNGGISTPNPLTAVLQLSHTRAISLANVSRLGVQPGAASPSAVENWADTLGRFSTPALETQDVPAFTARLHQRFIRTATAVGVSYAYAILTLWRPGTGVIGEYTSAVGRITATANGLSTWNQQQGTPLVISVTDDLTILNGDRVALEIHVTSVEDTLESPTEFLFEGGDETPPNGPPFPFDFAARIEMPDFVLA